MSAQFSLTPRYLLRQGLVPISPSMVQTADGPQVEAFFGFSGQSTYAAFIVESPTGMTPYPLVKRFLQTRIDLAADTLRLMVMDATGPKQARIFAATMRAVSEAFDSKMDSVEATHELLRDDASGQYKAHAMIVAKLEN